MILNGSPPSWLSHAAGTPANLSCKKTKHCPTFTLIYKISRTCNSVKIFLRQLITICTIPDYLLFRFSRHLPLPQITGPKSSTLTTLPRQTDSCLRTRQETICNTVYYTKQFQTWNFALLSFRRHWLQHFPPQNLNLDNKHGIQQFAVV